MIPGLSGSLLSHDAIDAILRSGAMPELAAGPPPASMRPLRSCLDAIRQRIGPACGARLVFDLVADPLGRTLGFGVIPLSGRTDVVEALLHSEHAPAAVMIVTAWGQAGGTAWRQTIHRGLAHGVRWGLLVAGPAVRLIDIERPYARRYAEFDLDIALDTPQTLAVLWGLLRAEAMKPGTGATALDRAVLLCEAHRAEVRRSLRHGVHEALLQLVSAFRRAAAKRHPAARMLDESLVVIYRILFLLFAEARGLVPAWHPVYREGYTLEALGRRSRGTAPAGVWETLQAIARLAHRGCRAGTLRVPPFNGRLFSPAEAPLADTVPLDDRVVARALDVLTVRKGRSGPERISYADLGVEQLGSVYEHLLDYDLSASGSSAPSLVPTGRRKATGSFYTPRALTEFLVRRTLGPLVRDAPADRILALRVLDPAMGSGAFLVAACRYLAAAYEHALVRDGALAAPDVRDDDRAAFRRSIAQHCLFGVDVNPMAVQLGRLSLWLATLAAGKPLSFLDHHLRAGNSLVGASIDDILRNPAPGTKLKSRDLPLFALDRLQSSLEAAVVSRRPLFQVPDDSLEQVREKERTLAALNRPGGPLDRWKSAADVWCAGWYPGAGRAADRATYRALLDRIMDLPGALPPKAGEALLAEARALAARKGFFHWPCEFPEVFYDQRGQPRPDAGFDAILGNPPWDMLRDDGPGAHARDLHTFVRASGIYRLQPAGHANLYQLFIERTGGLLKPGGRTGLILPSGFAADQSAASLRRWLFDSTSIDTFTTLDNHDGIFPIHRSLKFLLLTFTRAGSTSELPIRSAIRSAGELDRVADSGPDAAAIPLPRALVERLGGDSLAVPEIRDAIDVEILTHVAFRIPALTDPDGWSIHFGRELNATDDRPHFREDGKGLPVLEGKHLRPFGVDVSAARRTIPAAVAAKLLRGEAFRRARLGYRDVASATNRTTLIAALVPAGTVTTHTIFCVKEALDDESQHFLCGMFNSFVANYLVRLRVGTHVTAAAMARLPVPKPPREDPLFCRVARLSRSLSREYTGEDAAALNALAAHLYGLSPQQFVHILGTFPLIPEEERTAALRAFVATLNQP